MFDPIGKLLKINIDEGIEQEYFQKVFSEINFVLRIGTVCVAIGLGVLLPYFISTGNIRNMEFFYVYLAVFYGLLALAFISSYFPFRLRRLMIYITGPLLTLLMNCHIMMVFNCLDESLRYATVGIIIGLILVFYFLERSSITLSTLGGWAIGLSFLYHYRDFPNLYRSQLYFQVITTNLAGFFIGCHVAKSNLEQFRLRRRIEEERQNAKKVLYQVLPEQIAEELMSGQKAQAKNHASVSIIFSDLVNFTEMSHKMKARQLVWYLDHLFTGIDKIADELGVEKIKTIGDGYMAVCGCPNEVENHADLLAEFALRKMALLKKFNQENGTRFDLRAALHTGPVVAGVICEKRFCYDLWGKTVNVASRLEGHAEPGHILASSDFIDAIRDKNRFNFRDRRIVHPRGGQKIEVANLHNHKNDMIIEIHSA